MVFKKIHADGGSQFRSSLAYLSDQGVDICIKTSYTPESNRLVERAHQTKTANACIFLSQENPGDYSNFDVRQVVDYWNSVLIASTGKNPQEVLFESADPHIRHLRPFRCPLPYLPVQGKLRTFDPRV